MALAVPNFSEGRDEAAIAAIAAAFAPAAVLDRHTDAIHNRTVLTLSAAPTRPGRGAARRRPGLRGADRHRRRSTASTRGSGRSTSARWSGSARRPDRWRASWRSRRRWRSATSACRCSSTASWPRDPRRARARLLSPRRQRGAAPSGCARASCGPDFGPAEPHPTAGATLVTARPPLAAFNVELDTAEIAVARAVAAGLRESGGGLGGVRAIGVDLGDRAQVSTNVHDPIAVPLGAVIERVRVLAAEHGARPVAAEVVGLVPAAVAARAARGRAAARLRPGPARAREPARRARGPVACPDDGADEAQATAQASRHPDRQDRQPRPARAPSIPRRGPRAGQAALERHQRSARRAGARPSCAALFGAAIFLILMVAAFGRTFGEAPGALGRDAGDVRAARLLRRPLLLQPPPRPRAPGQGVGAASSALARRDGGPLPDRRPGGRELLPDPARGLATRA